MASEAREAREAREFRDRMRWLLRVQLPDLAGGISGWVWTSSGGGADHMARSDKPCSVMLANIRCSTGRHKNPSLAIMCSEDGNARSGSSDVRAPHRARHGTRLVGMFSGHMIGHEYATRGPQTGGGVDWNGYGATAGLYYR
ncbi:uncharacterized protein CANTADRAFT_19550 [Suhomyces tanzawaensis NRRL Y-17324]|uniref:Uncharacterized protein n=1 Tax=Suhomyces tanzawaensis NRRL Y-17324 TaxID=984487 RepID=A0A1E4SR78_9ASCO|nr:uncharacterized protein CANTADRAFT_19550 [Suhomyces tanzawaensis NRRL Y-17324]ODV81947.1 hypothetical protein CANTADRAFT_19550 [Suhomyces tanzawaensis NRRL Y-17324]